MRAAGKKPRRYKNGKLTNLVVKTAVKRAGSVIIAATAVAALGATYIGLDIADLAPGFLTTKPATYGSAPIPTVSAPRDAVGSELEAITVAAQISSAPVQKGAANAALQRLAKEVDTLGAIVVDASSGQILAAHEADKMLVPASNTKIFGANAVAALRGIGSRQLTRLYLQSPSVLRLVGEGDMLLGTGQAGPLAIQGRASLTELAETAAKKLRAENISSVTVQYQARDAGMNPAVGKDAAYVWEGRVASPAIDTGRLGQRKYAPDPALAAAQVFAKELQKLEIKVGSIGAVKAGERETGTLLAQVESAPLAAALRRTLKESDNTLADSLCIFSRETAEFAAIDSARFPSLPKGAPTQAHLNDCSGMSLQNRVSAKMVAAQLATIAADPTTRALVTAMPVAGLDGTLRTRFEKAAAAGRLRAKTGTQSGVRALSGYLSTKSGANLIVAVIVNGIDDEKTGGVKELDAIDAFMNELAGL